MQTIGQLIARSPAAASQAARIHERELRRYRVRLSVVIFADLEVDAYSAHEACSQAEQNPHAKPSRDFMTAPCAHRVEVWQPWNQTWAEVKRSDL
jgi:hypothetical protein